MAQMTYASRLRYLDADDLDDSVVDFDGLDVRGTDNAKLGDVEGFLVDPASGRVLYVVVDSGGWFSSRRFLLPIGHAAIDRDASALRVDVARDTLRTYPEFDEDRFREFSDEDFNAYEKRMTAACCPDDATSSSGSGLASDGRRHYTQPAWWSAGAYTADRLRPVQADTFAREDRNPLGRDDRNRLDREDRNRVGDASPHLDGRAQPGDVLGIETGGETTGIGDTAEDEDKRRRASEEALRKDS